MAAFQHDLLALFEQALHKRCSACRETKPVASFSHSRREKDGLKRECKVCCKVMRKRHYEQNSEKEIAASAAYQAAHPEKQREWNRKAQAKGRDKFNAQKRARYHANKAAICAGNKQRYHTDPDYRAKRLAASRQTKAASPAVSRAAVRRWHRANKPRVDALRIRWREENPEIARVAAVLGQQRRRARMRNLPGKLERGTWDAVRHYYGAACAYCFSTTKKLTVDHLLPVSRSGTNAEDNLAPACARCNSSKGDRTPLEYLAGIRLT